MWLDSSMATPAFQPVSHPDPMALYAGSAVDTLPDQVGMAVVAGGLLDHVDIDPAEADVLPPEAASVGQSTAGALLTSPADLSAPGREGIPQDRTLSQLEAPVGTTRIGLRLEIGRAHV